MKHVLCMVWTVDNEACVVYDVDCGQLSMCCVWCGLWKMKHVLCMMWTVDNEACVVYGVDCRQ